ncbi:ChbG/HpnK family deacetylase [Flavihumibacter fluvii]|uniref:ChbG/HpnK family deacetylase n=1 Tax=Flavihumibacter fluvii TaxID=2838157 RepID=UPI001BDEDF31|nr:ChbG/HpnK family deacetylase [Flavihumibacter fluvii]ULQ52071.1 serine hydrolase [Flavihumibacter fluvii]
MKSIAFSFLFCILLFNKQFATAQDNNSLPRSTPEAQGVSSESLIRFIDTLQNSPHEFHSIMILRHGKVIAEGWWKPFQPNLVHTMYSCSKSFTATAIGFLVAEKKLTVEDKVISFFPDKLPDNISDHLKALRIRDLLSMSVGQEEDPTWAIVQSPDWIKEFLKTPIKFQPGTAFLYNSAATYMLSAIVQKVSGEKLVDFLQPRLFAPLHIKEIDWETDPQGINTGGWGLRLKTEDMAKFGQLFLQKGIWQSKQIIPAAWIEEASTMKIMQDPSAPEEKKSKSDWLQGYCYQMWRGRHNSFRGDGAFGQYILVIPDEDVVVAITSETGDMQAELDMVWDHLLPIFQEPIPKANAKQQKRLKNKLANLSVKTGFQSSGEANQAATISGKTFGIVSLQRGLDSLRINFNKDQCRLTVFTDSVPHELNFGKNQWLPGTTTRKGPYLVSAAKNNRNELTTSKIAGAYTWKDDHTLDMKILYYESPHTETIRCIFYGDSMRLENIASFDPAHKASLKTVPVETKVNAPRLIMRGDDMGFSHSGNLALEQSYSKGIETSIELLAVSPWFPEAVKWLADHPNIEVGLHFAITSEWDNIKWRPLTDAPSLRNADGYFYPMLFPNKNYPKHAVLENAWKLDELEKELRAQIILAKKYVPRLNHISGHMGSVNFDPQVTAMAKRVAASYNLDLVDAGFPVTWLPVNLQNKTPEQKIDAFIASLSQLQDGKTYLFVEHPGLNDAELQAIHHIGYENVAEDRQGVTDLFTSEKLKEAIVRRGIQLVGYGKAISAE